MKWIYYLLIKPISLLPLFITYRLSDLLYLILYYGIGYRKGVVRSNMDSTLVHLSQVERRKVEREFYRHFCDIIIESIHLFSMSDAEFKLRMTFENPEIFDHYFQNGRSVLAVSGHYNNWEYFGTMCNAPIPHQAVGIYTPLTNSFMNRKVTQSRGRYGVLLLAKKEVKAFFNREHKEPFVVFFGADQSPSKNRKAYEMEFLGRKTRVQFGLEKYATTYNLPVLFFYIKKIKRGYYQATFEVLHEDPQRTQYGELTALHTNKLAEVILEKPAYWLWTHKRWKGMNLEGELTP